MDVWLCRMVVKCTLRLPKCTLCTDMAVNTDCHRCKQTKKCYFMSYVMLIFHVMLIFQSHLIAACCHSSRIRILRFFFQNSKNAFFTFLSKKNRKRYQVYHIARMLAYTVRSEINTYTYNII